MNEVASKPSYHIIEKKYIYSHKHSYGIMTDDIRCMHYENISKTKLMYVL